MPDELHAETRLLSPELKKVHYDIITGPCSDATSIVANSRSGARNSHEQTQRDEQTPFFKDTIQAEEISVASCKSPTKIEAQIVTKSDKKNYITPAITNIAMHPEGIERRTGSYKNGKHSVRARKASLGIGFGPARGQDDNQQAATIPTIPQVSDRDINQKDSLFINKAFINGLVEKQKALGASPRQHHPHTYRGRRPEEADHGIAPSNQLIVITQNFQSHPNRNSSLLLRGPPNSMSTIFGNNLDAMHRDSSLAALSSHGEYQQPLADM